MRISLPSVYILYMLTSRKSLSNNLGYQTGYYIANMLVFKQPLYHSVMTLNFKNSDAKEASEHTQGKVNSGTVGSTADHIGKSRTHVAFSTLHTFRNPQGS